MFHVIKHTNRTVMQLPAQNKQLLLLRRGGDSVYRTAAANGPIVQPPDDTGVNTV
jgi:hypothetical protein